MLQTRPQPPRAEQRKGERPSGRGTQAPGATLASILAGGIRETILRGEHPPGSKLRLDELREAYGVSLSPLREALSRLAAEGLVIAQDQRGYRVAPVSPENLEEVTRLRVVLEGMALQESIRLGDEHWEAEVIAAFHRLTRLEQRSPKRERIPEWEARHRDFHFALLAACGMPLLLQFCRTLHDFSDRYRRVFLARNPLDRDVHAEHLALLQAAIERKQRKAVELLEQHVTRTSANVRSALQRKAKR
jgi:GntR family carbon starvation induced transcriptional regulator